MTPLENSKPPSEKLIGARVRVRSDRSADAARVFNASGFEPIYVEHRSDGDVTFWFGKASEDVVYRIATSIPREFYAVHGRVVGNNAPFSVRVGSDG